jgi:hypothetical protein
MMIPGFVPYTGVGSRKTPVHVAMRMDATAVRLRKIGFWCRTGEARGADAAFRDGAEDCCTVFDKSLTNEASLEIARQHHPAWHKVSHDASLLLGRNPFQVLGINLDPVQKSAFLICYTEDGMASGGTGTTMRIAHTHHVPVFNFYFGEPEEKRLWDFIHELRTLHD